MNRLFTISGAILLTVSANTSVADVYVGMSYAQLDYTEKLYDQSFSAQPSALMLRLGFVSGPILSFEARTLLGESSNPGVQLNGESLQDVTFGVTYMNGLYLKTSIPIFSDDRAIKPYFLFGMTQTRTKLTFEGAGGRDDIVASDKNYSSTIGAGVTVPLGTHFQFNAEYANYYGGQSFEANTVIVGFNFDI